MLSFEKHFRKPHFSILGCMAFCLRDRQSVLKQNFILLTQTPGKTGKTRLKMKKRKLCGVLCVSSNQQKWLLAGLSQPDLDFALMCIRETSRRGERTTLLESDTFNESDSVPGMWACFNARTRWPTAEALSCKTTATGCRALRSKQLLSHWIPADDWIHSGCFQSCLIELRDPVQPSLLGESGLVGVNTGWPNDFQGLQGNQMLSPA